MTGPTEPARGCGFGTAGSPSQGGTRWRGKGNTGNIGRANIQGGKREGGIGIHGQQGKQHSKTEIRTDGGQNIRRPKSEPINVSINEHQSDDDTPKRGRGEPCEQSQRNGSTHVTIVRCAHGGWIDTTEHNTVNASTSQTKCRSTTHPTQR